MGEMFSPTDLPGGKDAAAGAPGSGDTASQDDEGRWGAKWNDVTARPDPLRRCEEGGPCDWIQRETGPGTAKIVGIHRGEEVRRREQSRWLFAALGRPRRVGQGEVAMG